MSMKMVARANMEATWCVFAKDGKSASMHQQSPMTQSSSWLKQRQLM